VVLRRPTLPAWCVRAQLQPPCCTWGGAAHCVRTWGYRGRCRSAGVRNDVRKIFRREARYVRKCLIGGNPRCKDMENVCSGRAI
jgi:hypothetical protein